MFCKICGSYFIENCYKDLSSDGDNYAICDSCWELHFKSTYDSLTEPMKILENKKKEIEDQLEDIWINRDFVVSNLISQMEYKK